MPGDRRVGPYHAGLVLERAYECGQHLGGSLSDFRTVGATHCDLVPLFRRCCAGHRAARRRLAHRARRRVDPGKRHPSLHRLRPAVGVDTNSGHRALPQARCSPRACSGSRDGGREAGSSLSSSKACALTWTPRRSPRHGRGPFNGIGGRPWPPPRHSRRRPAQGCEEDGGEAI